MADTFETVWRKVLLHCPDAPVGLALTWVQLAYNRVCDRRRKWSYLRGETSLTLAAARGGTCGVTQGSATVTPLVLTFSAADVGRQFRVDARGTPYSILALAGANITLDRVYEGTTAAAASGQILDAFVTLPEDFGGWLSVIDPYDSRQISTDVEEAELNFQDPDRQTTGVPMALVSRRLSSLTATDGRVQYEFHPYWTGSTSRSYPAYYWKRPGDLTDETVFKGPLRFRTDILLEGALGRAALWPGTADRKNPYFSMELARGHNALFEQEVAQLEAADEEIYLTWLETIGLQERDWGHPPMMGMDLRSHDS